MYCQIHFINNGTLKEKIFFSQLLCTQERYIEFLSFISVNPRAYKIYATIKIYHEKIYYIKL